MNNQWIAIRLYRQQENNFKHFAEERGVECYVLKRGTNTLLHNLAFVKAEKAIADELIADFQNGETAIYLTDMFEPERQFHTVEDEVMVMARRAIDEDRGSSIITVNPQYCTIEEYFMACINQGNLNGLKCLAKRIKRSKKLSIAVSLCCNIAIRLSPMSDQCISLL